MLLDIFGELVLWWTECGVWFDSRSLIFEALDVPRISRQNDRRRGLVAGVLGSNSKLEFTFYQQLFPLGRAPSFFIMATDQTWISSLYR